MKKITDILSDLEYISADIETALKVLAAYSNAMSDAVESIEPKKPWTVQVFINNFSYDDSVLQLSRSSLNTSLKKLNETIEVFFDSVKGKKYLSDENNT